MKITPKLYVLAFLLTATTLAHAHAFLDHADPRVGSTVQAPGKVTIWFTEEVEIAFSHIKVFDAQGNEVDRKDTKVDPSDKSVLTVSLPKLPPGKYKVAWSVIAIDTHHTTGTFPFTVAP